MTEIDSSETTNSNNKKHPEHKYYNVGIPKQITIRVERQKHFRAIEHIHHEPRLNNSSYTKVCLQSNNILEHQTFNTFGPIPKKAVVTSTGKSMELMPYNPNDSELLISKVTMNAIKASKINVNRLINVVELMHKKLQEFVNHTRNEIKQYRYTAQKTKLKINIELPNVIKYLNSQDRPKQQNVKQQSWEILPYTSEKFPNHDLTCRKAPKAIIRQTSISIIVTNKKHNSVLMDLIKSLSLNNSNLPNRKCLPSLFIRDWRIRNVAQGYILSMLLRKCNVASLKLMRNFYFVIITTTTPNLTIELNFKFLDDLYMLYDDTLLQTNTFEGITFNEEHRKLLGIRNIAPAVVCEALPKVENTQNQLSICFGQLESEDSSSTLKMEDANMSDDSDNCFNSASCSESEYFEIQSCDSILSVKESNYTLTLSSGKKSSLYNACIRKVCEDLNMTDLLLDNLNLQGCSLERCETLLSKFYGDSALRGSLQINTSSVFVHTFLNESLFDFTSVNHYVSNLYWYWKGLKYENVFKKIVIDFGKQMLHTFFSANVPTIET